MDAISMRRKLEPFFRRYTAVFTRALKGDVDTDALTHSFADYFVGSSPAGVYGSKNGLLFKFMSGRGFRFYRKVGTTSMRMSSLKVSRLDDLHALARVTFVTRVRRRKDDRLVQLRFTNFYCVQMLRAGPKIFAYMTGDEHALMEKHGLL